jgi:signal transduction histidine kinase
MRLVDPSLVALLFSAVVDLVLVFAIIKSRNVRENASYSLAAYSILSFLWTAVQLLQVAQAQPGFHPFDTLALQRISLYILLIVSLVLLHLTRIFERKLDRNWPWWAGGGAVFLLSVLFNENWLRLSERIYVSQAIVLLRSSAAYYFIIVGCVFFTLTALFFSVQGYRRRTSPLHRNRNLYWSATVLFFLIGQIFFLFHLIFIASLIHTFALITACYTWLTHHLPDLRRFSRRGASYFIIALLTIAIYTTGFVIIQNFCQRYPGLQPVVAAGILALVMALLISPLLNLVRQTIDRTLHGSHYDPHQTLSEYSASISNILDLEYLAMIVVSLISEAMEITHGALVIVSYDPGGNVFIDEGAASYALRLVNGTSQYIPDGILSERSPVVYTLCREHQPLTQYDIDLLARFKQMNPSERAWLDSLDMDVYVPIYAKDTWIGILALGPKKTGERYYEDDLSILQTLADQTAIALENARLYENLKQRNTENEILNAELKQANTELARLDEAKSDFINIASHELRTPLTQVIGYNDILGEMIKANDLDPQTGGQMVDSVRKAARRLEEIVETMFDVSKLESRTLDLTRMPVTLASIITVAIDTWAKGMDERKQTITVHGIANLPPVVGDGKRLAQVFTNLVQNAIKSTPDGGHIRITGKLLEPAGEDEEGCIEVIVEDNGIGIAPDDLERVFQKFFRVGNVLLHSTGDTKFKGAGPGLGLTIARGIIEAHGGSMWAESLGHDEITCPGSKFHVILPIQPRLLTRAEE